MKHPSKATFNSNAPPIPPSNPAPNPLPDFLRGCCTAGSGGYQYPGGGGYPPYCWYDGGGGSGVLYAYITGGGRGAVGYAVAESSGFMTGYEEGPRGEEDMAAH